MITSEEIKSRLWEGANELRGSMDASRYKDYMLGLMFYKFLSDKTLEIFFELIIGGNKHISEDDIVNQYFEMFASSEEELKVFLTEHLHYYVRPEYLYQTWINKINDGEFEVELVIKSLQEFEKTIALSENANDFKGLFANSTLDFTNSALGNNLNERSKNIQALILLFEDLNMVSLQEGDVLGDAYEYLIGQFAMESGAKAGEFYTPKQVSEVMSQIIAQNKNIRTIYDPTVGSGSLLLSVGKHLDSDSQQLLHYFGQEKNTTTYNLTRMNLLLHGVNPNRMTIKNGDTLGVDWPQDPEKENNGILFDAVVMNPPYSLKNWNKSELKVNDARFEVAGVLPPNSRGDYAFLLHGLYHLHPEGTMAIVLPHGVLFREGTEGFIRQRLLENNNIDAVIGLPSSLFTNTGIPVTIIILKKNRKLEDPVLIINASENFVKQGKYNVLLEKDIAQIVDIYNTRQIIPGFSNLITREEIKKNENNLNIPRYVQTIENEIPHDVDGHLLGGIPKQNIESLKNLNNNFTNILKNSLEEIRDGYFLLNKPAETIIEQVLNSEYYKEMKTSLETQLNKYIDKYWFSLKTIDHIQNIKTLKNDMLFDIKMLLLELNISQPYEGYQIIVNLWQETLQKDLEEIASKNFYEVGKEKQPRMVTKGTGKNKRLEQDGWIGVITPNDLIAKYHFNDELNKLEKLINTLHTIESELSELVESAKTEETDEHDVLYDALNKNKDDEPTNSFGVARIKNELKFYEKDSKEYYLLKSVQKLMTDRTNANRKIKDIKEKLEEDIIFKLENLTNKEIDFLIRNKWFKDTRNSILNLIKVPIMNEIETLKMLDERYNETLEDIDYAILKHETTLKEFIEMLVISDE